MTSQRSSPESDPVRAPVVDESVPFSSSPEAIKAAEYVAVAAARMHAKMQASGEEDEAYESNNYRESDSNSNGRGDSNEHDVRATAQAQTVSRFATFFRYVINPPDHAPENSFIFFGCD